LLQELLSQPNDHETAVLDALLSVACSEMTYRSRYRMSVAAKLVTDLLLLDESNPRSIAFQLSRIDAQITALPHDKGEGERSDVERKVLSMLAGIRLADVEALILLDEQGVRLELHHLLSKLDDTLPEFSDGLNRQYLTHAQPGKALSPLFGELNLGTETTL